VLFKLMIGPYVTIKRFWVCWDESKVETSNSIGYPWRKTFRTSMIGYTFQANT